MHFVEYLFNNFQHSLVKSRMIVTSKNRRPTTTHIFSRFLVVSFAFFAAMGCLNLWVAFNFSTSAWVNFKLFGGMGLMFVFIMAQVLYLNKRMLPETTP